MLLREMGYVKCVYPMYRDFRRSGRGDFFFAHGEESGCGSVFGR